MHRWPHSRANSSSCKLQCRRLKCTFHLPKTSRQCSGTRTDAVLGFGCGLLRVDCSPNQLHPWRSSSGFPLKSAAVPGSEKLWRSRSPRHWAPGRLKRVGCWISGRLQLRPTGCRARRRPRSGIGPARPRTNTRFQSRPAPASRLHHGVGTGRPAQIRPAWPGFPNRNTSGSSCAAASAAFTSASKVPLRN